MIIGLLPFQIKRYVTKYTSSNQHIFVYSLAITKQTGSKSRCAGRVVQCQRNDELCICAKGLQGRQSSELS